VAAPSGAAFFNLHGGSSMKVTLPYQLVLLVRGEGSKTPLIVLPHEVDILRAVHGEDSIQLTDETPPIKEATFDTADEFARLEQYYKGGSEHPNPTREIFRNLDEFEGSFDVGSDKEALIAQAKELGIPATKTWGIAKLQAAIDEALNE
jgi:hypothetical protein